MPLWPVSFKFSVAWSARSDLGLEVSVGLLPGSVLGWAATSLWHSKLSPEAHRVHSDTELLLRYPACSRSVLRSLQVYISSIWLLFQPALSILFKPLVAVKTGQSQRPQAAHTRPPRLCSCLGPDHPWARGMRSYPTIQPCSPSLRPRHPAGNQGSCLLYFLRKSDQSGRLLFLNSCWYPVSFQFLENQPPSITGSIILFIKKRIFKFFSAVIYF